MRLMEVRFQYPAEVETKLLAFCAIVLEGELGRICVKDIRIIREVSEDGKASEKVAMPSRELKSRCRCRQRNIKSANFCNWCGMKLNPNPSLTQKDTHVDCVHPIDKETRELLCRGILEEYWRANNIGGRDEVKS